MWHTKATSRGLLATQYENQIPSFEDGRQQQSGHMILKNIFFQSSQVRTLPGKGVSYIALMFKSRKQVNMPVKIDFNPEYEKSRPSQTVA